MDLWKHQILTCCPPSAVVLLEVVVAAVAAAPLFLLRPMALDFRIPVGIQMIYGSVVMWEWRGLPPIACPQNPNPRKIDVQSHTLCSSILRPPLICSFDPLLSPKYQSIHSFDSLPLLVKFVHKLHLSASLRYFWAKTGSSSLTLPFSFHPSPVQRLPCLELSSSPTRDYTSSHLDFPGKEPQRRLM